MEMEEENRLEEEELMSSMQVYDAVDVKTRAREGTEEGARRTVARI